MAATMDGIIPQICETSGCDKEAKLRCPTCVKLGIPGSFFCSQVSVYCILLQFIVPINNSVQGILGTYYTTALDCSSSCMVVKSMMILNKSREEVLLKKMIK